MRNLLALLAFALLTFVAVGWYLEWYKVQSTKTQDGNRHLNIDIHSQKIEDDLQKGSNKLHDAWEKRRKNESVPIAAPETKPGV